MCVYYVLGSMWMVAVVVPSKRKLRIRPERQMEATKNMGQLALGSTIIGNCGI
jgi:hypothetical protein